MNDHDINIGRDYAGLINATAKEVNGLIVERKRLIKLMEKAGWIIYRSERDAGHLAGNYAPIIKSIKQFAQTVVEIES